MTDYMQSMVDAQTPEATADYVRSWEDLTEGLRGMCGLNYHYSKLLVTGLDSLRTALSAAQEDATDYDIRTMHLASVLGIQDEKPSKATIMCKAHDRIRATNGLEASLAAAEAARDNYGARCGDLLRVNARALDEVRRADKDRDACREVLRSVEWIPDQDVPIWKICPSCHKIGTHDHYCALAACLKETP